MKHKLISSSLVRYVGIGALSYALELAVLLALHRIFGFSAGAATAVAFWVGLLVAFYLQKILAFQNYQKELRALSKQWGLYALLVGFNYFFTIAVVSILPEQYVAFSRTGALLITTAWNYVLYKHVIFSQNSFREPYRHVLAYYRTNWIYSSVTAAALLLLVSCTAYGTLQVSYVAETNADALVNTYLVGDGVRHAQINLQPEHTNILKFPLFYLQSLFPYTTTSFATLNLFLSISAVLGWVYLLRKILGKHYTLLITLTLTTFVFGSLTFNNDFVWTTIRNIEFPLALLYIYLLTTYLGRKTVPTRREHVLLALITFGYAILVASDVYFQYTVSLAILAFLALVFAQTRRLTNRMVIAGVSVLSASLLAKAILAFLVYADYIALHSSGSFAHKIVSLEHLGISIQTAFSQLLTLTGANIFGQALAPRSTSMFINAFLLIIAIGGGILLLQRTNRELLQKRSLIAELQTHSSIVIVAICFFLTFFMYVFSGQAAHPVDGKLITGPARYITFMVFLAVPLFVWTIKHYYDDHRILKIGLVLLIVLGILANAPIMPERYAKLKQIEEPTRARYDLVAQTLKEHDVDIVLSGHWLGATTRFWSQDNVKFAPIIGCDDAFLALSRGDWFSPENNKRSALLIERAGNDAMFWGGCTNERLRDIYGTPANIIQLDNARYIWTYEYDVRNKID